MSNQNRNAWFVSLEHLLDDEGAPLRPIHASTVDTDRPIQDYEALTISLESFCISKQLDRRVDGNDLLVRTWTTYGDEPPIEIVHFFEKNVALGEARDNLAVEHMFAVESYSGQPIELDFQVLEVDGHNDVAEELQAAAHLFGAVFPTLLPFSSFTSTLYTHLKSIFKNPHDLAFSSTLRLGGLTGTLEDQTTAPLKCGAYILCDQDIDADQYVLRELKLEAIASDKAFVPSYIVIKIVPQVIHSVNSEDLLVNQRLAASLLKNDGDRFELPDNILTKQNRFAHSFNLLEAMSKNAYLIKRIVQYKQLKSRHQASILESISPRDRLNDLEKLLVLSNEIRDFFIDDERQ
ncbi:MAG: hypothetical protein AAFR31_07345 [Cyanobacteria bacterium J06627_8]